MFSESVRFNGSLIQALLVCSRQAWHLARSISADERDEFLTLGRLIDQNSYARERHQVGLGDNKFDFVQSSEGKLVVCEVKKSSRAEQSARLQLCHYLYELRKAGWEAHGVLMFPAEKKRVDVKLTDEVQAELGRIYQEIERIAEQNEPPPAENCKYCSKCAWDEYCWS